ncbi:hypothetical protein BLS_009456 [Venturia inaequalis]|uniref:Trafficking protein particle complex subunit 6B n=1 Tax=Venturia inaequalis TaxID=5025 RepID=A0A8H3ZFN4_VENIN|nr:hypothetical protein EG328_001522 [Venturia inaequalis]KAE9979775.1 hypothetical protein BLS_009456 [Venturia inaequalis]KAE9991512.1 hypothetical protein EG327_011532 [Venturia inaequalis]RDI86686.1 hypothetical protein Vi05172_g3396 [Venturia inaequalis]
MSFQSPNPSSLPTDDPNAPAVAAACFEFLLIELVPTAYRIAAEVAAREDEWLAGGHRVKDESGEKAAGETLEGKEKEEEELRVRRRDEKLTRGFGIGGIGGSIEGREDEEVREGVFWKLDGLGYRVGLGLVERFSRDKPRFQDTLDAIKFLCKDLWLIAFKKQIDNLKTNHRGVYVLTDNRFTPLGKMSLERGRDGMMAQAQPFLYFPAGLIRGALFAMGIKATVQAETSELPGATFQIRTSGARP